ncbi:Alpha/Beta hydrolase protein [Armillaria novae-zelandiae]|uniref:Alpha/Beta hydrolase protein n=1 Tax=Armillaria novae-zelandiae TaxID=153914 RepID=A0AA39TY85_9AGAR|nr:Alpha/Beta hydrolase protein [Armillaria novae-zelandiae]
MQWKNVTEKVDISQERAHMYPEFNDMGIPHWGQTVIKLREGTGKIPLILIHGAGGFMFEFTSYTEKFRMAVWALQVTPETPLRSLDEMAASYFHKVKAEQPHGPYWPGEFCIILCARPYRLALYSAASILLIVLVKLFEDNGDTVLQVVMLDNFPATFIYSTNKAGNPDPRNPDNMKAILDGGIKAIGGLMNRDGNRESLQRSLKQLLDAWDGMYVNDIINVGVHNIKSYMAATALFLYDLTTERDGKASIELLAQWMRTVKAPITVVIALEGSLGSIPKEDQEEWADLGVKRCLPDARVVFVSGGHYEFLTDERVIRLLQEGY